MKESTMKISACTVRVVAVNTAVVGTGAAGYNAADRLYACGQKDVAIVTDHVNAGTSRNTGSDKQTYYKLTLSGPEPDSEREMAETLFSGQCVDGDIALCEAALSAQSFLKLVELGVPFPKNRWGEYIGYKTDHDPRRRATSVGPYTSKRMTECLEQAVAEKGIRVFDGLQVIRLLEEDGQIRGFLCLDIRAPENADSRFVAFCCKNVIWATGGPACMYANSVYPLGHYGSSGIAFEAGVPGRNLTEWQYGLASVKPRWNVSGTYMQALPRFISTDKDGGNAREFLLDFFKDIGEMLTKVFLKGYQWPFDVRKVAGGSSIIDILVYMESAKGRRVWLDFRTNPGNVDAVDYAGLSEESREYLERAGACFGTPLDRLLQMNTPAVEFYREKDVDLAKQPLEIALCAQHNNGGLAVDAWWRTPVKGFFAAGEVAGSHGVYRPGGSALNAGQVGSTRAAQYIAARCTGEAAPDEAFTALAVAAVGEMALLADNALRGGESNVKAMWEQASERMSCNGAAIRSRNGIKDTAQAAKRSLDELAQTVRVAGPQELHRVYRLRDMLISQYVYLCAMLDYMEQGGKSRGSSLYSDPAGTHPYEQLPECFTFTVDDGSRGGLVQEITYQGDGCKASWRPVRPIPQDDDFFENVWRAFRKNGNIE